MLRPLRRHAFNGSILKLKGYSGWLFQDTLFALWEAKIDRTTVGVIGSSLATGKHYEYAVEVGRLVASRGAQVLTGGLGGVMEAACKGAREAGGTTIGILPGMDASDANLYVDIPIVTGLNHARNIIVVRSSAVLIAVGGQYGTLSEIAFALKLGKPVVGLDSWDVGTEILKADTPEHAVKLAFTAIGMEPEG